MCSEMDDGGRCLLDVIDDPILLESFLDEDSVASANAQVNASALGKNNLTSADIVAHNRSQIYVTNYHHPQQTLVDHSVRRNRIIGSTTTTTNSVNVCNGDNKPIVTAIQNNTISQANAPSPSVFNSPSPAVATSVLSPAVPSPSQSAATATFPPANSPNLISQLPAGSQIQIAGQPNNVGQQMLQIVTPVAAQSPRLQAAIRPKQLQILPKPSGPNLLNSAVTTASVKSAQIAGPRAMPMAQITAGLQAPGTQLLIGQPANAIIPQQVPQGGMILINTNHGPILIPNCTSMMPGMQLAVRQPTPPPAVPSPAPTSVPTAQAINQNQLLTSIQVAGQQAIVGQAKPPGLSSQQQHGQPQQHTIVIPANAMPAAFQQANNIVLNNAAIPAAPANTPSSNPSSHNFITSAASGPRPAGMVLAPQFVNGPAGSMQLQQLQTPQGQITVAVPTAAAAPVAFPVSSQSFVRPTTMAQMLAPQPALSSSPAIVEPEKPAKSQGVDLAELLKEHGIATEEEVETKQPPHVVQEPSRVQQPLPPPPQPQPQPFVFSLAQDGSVQLQSSAPVQRVVSPALSSSVHSSVPQPLSSSSLSSSSTALSQTHSVLLERLNTAPINGVNMPSSKPPPLIPLTVQQLPVSSSSPLAASSSADGSVISNKPQELPDSIKRTEIDGVVHRASPNIQTIHLTLATQQLLQRIQNQINQLTAEKNLSPSQKSILQQLRQAQHKILIDGKNAADMKAQESVQLSASTNQSQLQNDTQVNGPAKVAPGPNMHLANLLASPANNKPPSVIPTVIQPPMVINNNATVVVSAAPAGGATSQSALASSLRQASVQAQIQPMAIASQQQQVINHNKSQSDHQPMFAQDNNHQVQPPPPQQQQQQVAAPPMMLALQQIQSATAQPQQVLNSNTVNRPINSSLATNTLYSLQNVNKNSSSPILSKNLINCKIDSKPVIKTATVPKAALIQQKLAKDQKQVITPDTKTPFRSKKDVIDRLLPYHVFNGDGRTAKELMEADRLFEVISTGLLDKMQVMMNKYRHLLLKQSMKSVAPVEQVMLSRMFIEHEMASLKADKQAVSEGKELDLPPLPESWLQPEKEPVIVKTEPVPVDENLDDTIDNIATSDENPLIPCVESIKSEIDDKSKTPEELLIENELASSNELNVNVSQSPVQSPKNEQQSSPPLKRSLFSYDSSPDSPTSCRTFDRKRRKQVESAINSILDIEQSPSNYEESSNQYDDDDCFNSEPYNDEDSMDSTVGDRPQTDDLDEAIRSILM